MAILLLIFGILMFVGLVVVHEIGHFIVARRNGVSVEEFGIGFPPRAKILKKQNGTIYTLNWLPLGGFVKLKGENDADTAPGSFGAARLGPKVRIILAGVLMNFIAAVVIFTGLAFSGMPKADLRALPFYDKEQFTISSDTKIIKSQVFVGVAKDSPADKAGLKSGDELIRIGGEPIGSSEALPGLTERYKGQTIDLSFRRDNGSEQTVQATLNQTSTQSTGYLGVSSINPQVFRATWSAPIVGVGTAVQYTDLSFRGLGYVVQNLFKGQTQEAQNAVAGPVAIFKLISDSASEGLSQILFLIALISISLAVMNALPIPALDGGRLFVTLVFRALKKPLTRDREDLINGTGFMILLALIFLVTFLDIKRLFS